MIQEFRTLLLNGETRKALATDQDRSILGNQIEYLDDSCVVVPLVMQVLLDEHQRNIMNALVGIQGSSAVSKETRADTINSLAYSVSECKRLMEYIFDKRYVLTNNTQWYDKDAFNLVSINQDLSNTQGLEDFINLHLHTYKQGLYLYYENYSGVGKMLASAIALAISIRNKHYGK